MALINRDNVKATTTSTGTGNLALSSVPAPLDVIGIGNRCYVLITHENGDDWEISLCTLVSLSRDVCCYSSANGSKVNFSAGTKDVWLVATKNMATSMVPTGRKITAADLSADRGAEALIVLPILQGPDLALALLFSWTAQQQTTKVLG